MLLVGCMSAGPSSRAQARLPGAHTAGATTSAIPGGAVVRVAFGNPDTLIAIDGAGVMTTLPPVHGIIGRVSRRTGDTLWVAVSETFGDTKERLPARGSRARLTAVPLADLQLIPTVQVLNANPRRAEVLMTSGVVGFLLLVGVVIAVCSTEPCMQ